jgi:hypothetical protein
MSDIRNSCSGDRLARRGTQDRRPASLPRLMTGKRWTRQRPVIAHLQRVERQTRHCDIANFPIKIAVLVSSPDHCDATPTVFHPLSGRTTDDVPPHVEHRQSLPRSHSRDLIINRSRFHHSRAIYSVIAISDLIERRKSDIDRVTNRMERASVLPCSPGHVLASRFQRRRDA